jgi:hypothetical protein
MSYLSDAAMLIQTGRKAFDNQSYPDPRIDITTGKTHHAITQVKTELSRWEAMPNRRDPLTKGMLMRLSLLINPSLLFSLSYVLLDWMILGLHLGFRLSEWAQRKNITKLHQTKKNLDGRPKAFICDDFEFFAENRHRLTHYEAISCPNKVVTVDIRWRQQKNGQNGEKKTVYTNRKVHNLCGVRSAVRIIKRAIELDLDDEHPIGVFTDNGQVDGRRPFITDTHISDCLKRLAKLEYGITKTADLARYTSHSIRVGACVALHAAGIGKLDIQHALRWRSLTFWTYLRNLPTQAARCMTAIRDFDPMSSSD